MNIPTNLNRSTQLQQHRLIQQQLPHFITKSGRVGKGNVHGSPGLFVAGGQHRGDDSVDPLVVGVGGGCRRGGCGGAHFGVGRGGWGSRRRFGATSREIGREG